MINKKVWIVERITDYEGKELLYVFSESIDLEKIKEYINSNDFKLENLHKEPLWSKDNRLEINTFQRIEISLVEFDDWLFYE